MMYRVPFKSSLKWSQFKHKKSYISEIDESYL